MRIRVPPKRIRERFLIIYELKGCQRAVNFLTEFYGVRKMRVILDGKRVGKGYSGYYLKNRAYLTKKGLTKRIVLHELYHHLVSVRKFELPNRVEEKEADCFARNFFKRTRSI